MNLDLEKETSRIADAIVDLVERVDGPVTLCEVEREVAGFAKADPPYWDCYREHGGVQAVYWSGMTKAGADALHQVMFGHRVAVQSVGVATYLLEDRIPKDENWQPVVLLPAKAANLYTPKVLLRLPETFLSTAEIRDGWRVLTPSALSFTADGL